ncbi:hypothetical protein BCR42DRAFT_407292 [Absidia repens]|uniref:BZIP domain-containing protein n=1 Tax=Absidia repens TaxID=90262 RepID=A0A1X2IRZ1_9FUNG|nr:hypothetical protein BCR42DRAFT_407292 [Absidia repens]
MDLSDQYHDSFSDDSQDDSYSDYSAKAKTTKKRASTTNKKTNKIKATSTPKRPGRKPIEKSMDEELGGDPKLKRKAQNRAAQRAFRERKEKHVSELEDRIRELEQEKSSKETNLELENAKLKQELEKLRQENYSLKDSKFTFEYPRHDTTDLPSTASTNDKNTTISNAQPLDSPPLSSTTPTPSIIEDYNSGSNSDHIQDSFSSNNPIDTVNNNNSSRIRDISSSSSSSGSENNSPTSNNTKYENNMTSFTGTTSSNNNNTDYDRLFNISNQNSVASFGLLNDLGPNHIDTFSPSNNPENSALFHGKTDFSFSNYRNPVASADDWLFQDNSQLPGLLDVDANLYGLNQQTTNSNNNNNSFPLADVGFDDQMPSFYNTNNYHNSINTNFNPTSINDINSIYNNSNMYTNSMNNTNITNTTTYDNAFPSQQQQRTSFYNDPELTPSKAMVLETIRLAKEQGKTRLEVKAAVKNTCPDYDVDILCDELRRKVNCYDSAQPFSDHDLDIVASCVKQH